VIISKEHLKTGVNATSSYCCRLLPLV